jgi:hypothetical protein
VDTYCFLGNQPRFVAVPRDQADVIHFAMREITNLASPHAKHAATLRLIDEDHFSDEWHFVENGKRPRPRPPSFVLGLHFVRRGEKDSHREL